jgi:hypothetical protein
MGTIIESSCPKRQAQITITNCYRYLTAGRAGRPSSFSGMQTCRRMKRIHACEADQVAAFAPDERMGRGLLKPDGGVKTGEAGAVQGPYPPEATGRIPPGGGTEAPMVSSMPKTRGHGQRKRDAKARRRRSKKIRAGNQGNTSRARQPERGNQGQKTRTECKTGGQEARLSR